MRALLAILRAPSRWLDRRIDARIAARAPDGQSDIPAADYLSRGLRSFEQTRARRKASEFVHAPQRADAPRGELVWISERVAAQLTGCRIVREVGQRSYLVTDAPSACDALRPSPPQAH